MLLNVEFVDPPYIEQVSGKLGEADFMWVLADLNMEFLTTTQELQEKKIVDSWRRYSMIGESGGRRLVAALHYFHVACRLGRTGNSPWEFMSEILLNFCKILEVLFPSQGESQTMNSTRLELEKLGFSRDAIEKYYIPAIALRNKIDVAHVDLSTLPQKYLQVLHSYTGSAENEFRTLFQIMFSKIEAGQYSIPEYKDLEPRNEVIKTVEKMAESFTSK